MSERTNIHFRLKKEDYDLHLITAKTKFAKIIKEAIRAYINHSEFFFSLPLYSDDIEYSDKVITVSFSNKNDADIITFLNTLPNGRKSQIIKTIIRNAVQKDSVSVFLRSIPEQSRNNELTKMLLKQVLQNTDVSTLFAALDIPEKGHDNLDTLISASTPENVETLIQQAPYQEKHPSIIMRDDDKGKLQEPLPAAYSQSDIYADDTNDLAFL